MGPPTVTAGKGRSSSQSGSSAADIVTRAVASLPRLTPTRDGRAAAAGNPSRRTPSARTQSQLLDYLLSP
ncbi:MAG: hypothetical protein LC685_00930 [Actinobacteria bacterium]|nr:hypothetical protein [Actinomycetota bacterium]